MILSPRMEANRHPVPESRAQSGKLKSWHLPAGAAVLVIALVSGVISGWIALVVLVFGGLSAGLVRWYRTAARSAGEGLPDPAMAEQKERIRMIRKSRYLENVGDLGERVASQAEQIGDRMEQFQKMLNLKFDPAELTFQRYLSAAETTRLALLDQLQMAASALGSLSVSGPSGAADPEDSPPIRERLEIRRKQEARIRAILEFNEKALTEFDRVSAAISEVRTSRGLSGAALEDVLKELAELASRAKKYSNQEAEGSKENE
jgi:hypothetical protein